MKHSGGLLLTPAGRVFLREEQERELAQIKRNIQWEAMGFTDAQIKDAEAKGFSPEFVQWLMNLRVD